MCQAVLLELCQPETLEEVSHTRIELGIDVVMPLLEPRNKFRNTRQQGRHTLPRPALLFRHRSIPGRQSPGLLQVVPAGPADQKRQVGF